jgi:peptide-methionine (R)-S-oxide reductase
MRKLVANLSEEERHLLLEHGEEAPFCGVFLHEKREGLYTCRLCGLPLFKAVAKFESGTGCPSFTAPVCTENLFQVDDVMESPKLAE